MPDSTAGADHTDCPACRGRLYPRLLRCADCGLEVSTRYANNEFAELDADDLHLLRIFVVCEGRIRDMESALGVSYPTVKARLAALRGRLGLNASDASRAGSTAPDAGAATTREADARSAAPSAAENATSAAREPTTAKEILDRLADGTLTYDEALPKIRALRGRS